MDSWMIVGIVATLGTCLWGILQYISVQVQKRNRDKILEHDKAITEIKNSLLEAEKDSDKTRNDLLAEVNKVDTRLTETREEMHTKYVHKDNMNEVKVMIGELFSQLKEIGTSVNQLVGAHDRGRRDAD